MSFGSNTDLELCINSGIDFKVRLFLKISICNSHRVVPGPQGGRDKCPLTILQLLYRKQHNMNRLMPLRHNFAIQQVRDRVYGCCRDKPLPSQLRRLHS